MLVHWREWSTVDAGRQSRVWQGRRLLLLWVLLHGRRRQTESCWRMVAHEGCGGQRRRRRRHVTGPLRWRP